jgi:hypothetical protein
MRETDYLPDHGTTLPEELPYIPAQFRPSSQLSWRTPIVIATAIQGGVRFPDTSPGWRNFTRRDAQAA